MIIICHLEMIADRIFAYLRKEFGQAEVVLKALRLMKKLKSGVCFSSSSAV